MSGLDKVFASGYEFEYKFKYEGKWFTDKQLVKLTAPQWTNVKTRDTKYKILGNPERWNEIPFDFEGEAFAPVMDNYYIGTNGQILSKAGLSEQSTAALTVRLTNGNGERNYYYITSLLYHSFVDKSVDPTDEAAAWLPGINFFERKKENYVALGEIEKQDTAADIADRREKAKEKKENKSKKKSVAPAAKSSVEVDELMEAYNILLGKNKEMAQHILRLEAELKEAKGTEVVKVAAADKISDVLRTQRVNGVEREIILEGGKEYYRKGNSLILLNQEIMPRAESRTKTAAQYLGFDFGG